MKKQAEEQVNDISIGYDITNQYSSWAKLVLVVAFLKRAFSSFTLNVVSAENTLFYICQEELRNNSDNTRKRFLKFDLVCDSDGIIP